MRREPIAEQYLHDRSRMSDIVSSAVIEEQKGGEFCIGRIVSRRRIEFQEMENGKNGDEEWYPPQVVFNIQELKSEH